MIATAEKSSTASRSNSSAAKAHQSHQADSEHTPFFTNGTVQAKSDPFFTPGLQRKSAPEGQLEPTANGVQTKLAVGMPGDRYEQEADAMADRVTEGNYKQSSISDSGGIGLQKKPLARQITPLTGASAVQSFEETSEEVQAQSDSNTYADESFETDLANASGAGAPLADATRNRMEDGFGADFGNVRTHTGADAVQLNRKLGSQAFTHGNDIYFNEGKYAPGTREGDHLLAHELTHTIQQGGSGIQPKIIQKAEDGTKAPDNGGSIDYANKMIVIKELGIPRVKDNFTPSRFTIDFGQIPDRIDQRDDFVGKVKLGSDFDSALKAKKKLEKAPDMTTRGGKDVFYLKQKGETSPGRGLVMGTAEAIKRASVIPFWNRDGSASRYDVDHQLERQLGGENEMANYWLLESSANRSSGGLISAELNRRIKSVITEANAQNQSPWYYRKKENGYKLRVLNKTGLKGKEVKGRPNDYWHNEQIEKGKQLNGLKFLTKNEMEREGLISKGGSDAVPTHLLIMAKSFGGNALRIKWGENQDTAKGLKERIGNFTIQEVHYQPGGKENYIKGTAFKYVKKDEKRKLLNHDGMEIPLIETALPQFGGVIDSKAIKSNILGSFRFRGMSPVEIDLVDFHPTQGLVGGGRILPTLPFISDADIRMTFDEQGVHLEKTFTSDELSLPKPFSISETSLTISVGTSGLNVTGAVKFAVEKVGEGSIEGFVGSDGEFGIKGNFSFDSKLFDPATVEVAYENNQLSVAGKIGIPEGKIKGIKSAQVDVEYVDNTLTAKGSAKTALKGFEEFDMFLQIDEQKFVIGASVNLVGTIPRIKEGMLELMVTKEADDYKIAGSGTVVPDVPGMKENPSLNIRYDNGAIFIQGNVPFQLGKSKAEGDLTVSITNQILDENNQPTGEVSDKWIVFGAGKASIVLGKGIAAEAQIELTKDQHIIVSGEVGLDTSSQSPSDREKKWDKTLFEIGPPPILLFVMPPIGAALMLEIDGGVRIYAAFTPPYFDELSLSLNGFDLTHPEESQANIVGKMYIATSARAGIEMYLKLTATLSVLVAKVAGYLKGAAALELNGKARAGIEAKWSQQNGLEIQDGELSFEAMAQFMARLSGGLRVYLDFWLAQVDIWQKEIDIASVKFGDGYKVGLKLPVTLKDGILEFGSINEKALEFPDLSSQSQQMKLAKQAAQAGNDIKPPSASSLDKARKMQSENPSAGA